MMYGSYRRHFLYDEPGAGRIIRHRHDFGAILFLDTRFSLPSTSKYLPSWVNRSHQSFDSPNKLAGLLRGFFNKMKAMQRRGTLQSAKPVVTGRGGVFTTTTGSPMKKQDIDMLKRKSAMEKASQQRQQEHRDKLMEGFTRHLTEATQSPSKSEVKSILSLQDEDEVQDNSKKSKKRKSLFNEEPNTSPGNSVSKKRKKIKIKRKDELEEVLEEEKLKEWKRVLDQSEAESKNTSDPFKDDKISNRLCFEMNNALIPNVVEKYQNDVTDKKDFLAIILKFTKHMLTRACLLNQFNGNRDLEHFQFRWLENSSIEIENSASNPLMFHHQK